MVNGGDVGVFVGGMYVVEEEDVECVGVGMYGEVGFGEFGVFYGVDVFYLGFVMYL